MSSDSSVTQWLDGIQSGDSNAVRLLWDRYFRPMAASARRRLVGSGHLPADEEDVALSAFNSFCEGMAGGRFPDLAGRDNLWAILLTLTARKAADLIAWEYRRKRSGSAGRADSGELDRVPAGTPAPDAAAEMAEEAGRLIDRLADPTLQAIALMKLDGFTTREIAARLGIGCRTVERKVLVIRRLWGGEDGPG